MSDVGMKVDYAGKVEWLVAGNELRKLVKDMLAMGHKPLAYGKDRLTFDLGDMVLKIPRRPDYVKINECEAELYMRARQPGHKFFGRLAETCLLIIRDIPCILMEKLIPLEDGQEPEWAYDVDCAQVGLNPRTGEILAYDFADE